MRDRRAPCSGSARGTKTCSADVSSAFLPPEGRRDAGSALKMVDFPTFGSPTIPTLSTIARPATETAVVGFHSCGYGKARFRPSFSAGPDSRRR